MPLLSLPAAKPRRPRVLLVPPPALPVPAVQGGAVETLVTRLLRENERCGQLDLLCASIPDPEAMAQAPRREVPVGEKAAQYSAISIHPFW